MGEFTKGRSPNDWILRQDSDKYLKPDFDTFSPGSSTNAVLSDLHMFSLNENCQLSESDNSIEVTGKLCSNGSKVCLQLHEKENFCVICGTSFPHKHAVQGMFITCDGLIQFDLDLIKQRSLPLDDLILDFSPKQPGLFSGKLDSSEKSVFTEPRRDQNFSLSFPINAKSDVNTSLSVESFDFLSKSQPKQSCPPLLLNEKSQQHPLCCEDTVFKQKTASEKSLQTIQEEEKAKPFKCIDCGRGYASQAAVDNHALAHYGNRPHCCSICGKSFHLKKLLSQHMMVHTGARPFQCDQCPKTFTRGDRLKSHRQQHSGDRPFKCHLCDKSFTRKEALLTHIRSHTGSKPWMCEECGRAFSDPSNLKAHRNTHSDIKAYVCKECGKGFSRSFHLKTHCMSHDGVWTCVCDICGKRFRQKDKLDRHKIIHSDSKPFECSICSKHYKRKDKLKRHLKSHSSESSVNCPYCPKTFSRSDLLKQHVKQHSESNQT